ncbi:unnamed protein product, partial [Laminaria digitata]
GYLFFVQGEQRRVGVGVKQEPPLVAVQLRGLVRDMRRRARMLPTAAGIIAIIRDVAMFCVALHAMKRGFEPSVAIASQVLEITGGISNFLFGKTLRSSSQAVMLRKNLDCREVGAAAVVVEYHQAGRRET